MLARIAEIHRSTRKRQDVVWNRWVARPAASVVVALLESTSIKPNQLTLASLVLFVAASAGIALAPGWYGVLAAVLLMEFSYVLDCADGQLARWKKQATAIGAHLDFLMDALKALVLVAGVSVRLGTHGENFAENSRWLLEGIAGLAIVGAGLSLTTFMRRPEYAAATGQSVDTGAGDYRPNAVAQPSVVTEEPQIARKALPIRAAEALGHLLIHYPTHLPFFVLADRLDLFLHVYLAANAAHTARALLAITLKLGRR